MGGVFLPFRGFDYITLTGQKLRSVAGTAVSVSIVLSDPHEVKRCEHPGSHRHDSRGDKAERKVGAGVVFPGLLRIFGRLRLFGYLDISAPAGFRGFHRARNSGRCAAVRGLCRSNSLELRPGGAAELRRGACRHLLPGSCGIRLPARYSPLLPAPSPWDSPAVPGALQGLRSALRTSCRMSFCRRFCFRIYYRTYLLLPFSHFCARFLS